MKLTQEDIKEVLEALAGLAEKRMASLSKYERSTLYRAMTQGFSQLLAPIPREDRTTIRRLEILWTDIIDSRPDLIVTIFLPHLALVIGVPEVGRAVTRIEWDLLEAA